MGFLSGSIRGLHHRGIYRCSEASRGGFHGIVHVISAIADHVGCSCMGSFFDMISRASAIIRMVSTLH